MLYSLTSLLCFVIYLNKVHTNSEDDSLRNALKAIENRQRQLASSYYLVPSKGSQQDLPLQDENPLDSTSPDDYDVPYRGRLAHPKPASNPHFFDDDGAIDAQDEEYQRALNERLLEQLMLDILKNEEDDGDDHPSLNRRPQKKSFFREREINEISDTLQNLQPNLNTEHVPAERAKSKLLSPHRRLANPFEGDDFDDDYLNAVNPLWQKYEGQSIQGVDPESLSNEDIDGFLEYLGSQNSPANERLAVPELYETEYLNLDRDRSKRYWLGSSQPNLIQKRSTTSQEKPASVQIKNSAILKNHSESLQPTEKSKPPGSRDAKGQKEVPIDLKSLKPLNIKKKSIDWSNYFGVDKRQKKSSFSDGIGRPTATAYAPKEVPKSDVLLDQYIQSYILQSVRNSAFNNRANTYGYYPKRSNSRGEVDLDNDMNRKIETAEDLRAAEDLIIDHILKNTGAHQGIGDRSELQKFRQTVIEELGAAYNLEKLRNEIFDDSISSDAVLDKRLKKQQQHHHTTDKRIAIKKENAEFLPRIEPVKAKYNSSHGTLSQQSPSPYHHTKYRYETQNASKEACPILNDIMGNCLQISMSAEDSNSIFTPFCTLHHICNICGTKDDSLYCDLSFYSDISLVCSKEDVLCKYTAQRILAALQDDETESFLNRYACDPCVAEILQYSYE